MSMFGRPKRTYIIQILKNNFLKMISYFKNIETNYEVGIQLLYGGEGEGG